MNMKNYYKFRVVLVKYPFTDNKYYKIRPAVIINGKQDDLNDFFIVPLTSKTHNLKKGEFVLNNYSEAGLNIPSAIKRGIFTVNSSLFIKELSYLSKEDREMLKQSIFLWLQL